MSSRHLRDPERTPLPDELPVDSVARETLSQTRRAAVDSVCTETPSSVQTAQTLASASAVDMNAMLKAVFPGIPDTDLAAFGQSVGHPEPYALGRESQPQEGIQHGVIAPHQCAAGKVYPGVAHDYWVYTPAHHDPMTPTCLMVFLDGARYLGPEINVPAVFDHLIHSGAMPPTIGVFVQPGTTGPGLPVYGGNDNRSIEYDSLGGDFARFLIDELIPEATRGFTIAPVAAARAICGLSSGGICAFNAAWERPDFFGKVVSHCGSFVDIRGGHQLAPAVRRAPAKPLRVFLQTGARDLNILFGNWVNANRDLAAALTYRGYDHRLVIGDGGHSLAHGGAIFPETLRWLWRDWRNDSHHD